MKFFQKRKAEKARRKKWEIERQRIETLKKSLSNLGEIPQDSKTIFEYAVKFFNVVSQFQDDGLIYNAPAELAEYEELLNTHVRNAGRCHGGYNRTKPGELVTLENTFWGNMFGVWTFTGKFWSECDESYDGFKRRWLRPGSTYEDNPLVRKVIADYQVIPFLKSHLQPMLEICEKMTVAA